MAERSTIEATLDSIVPDVNKKVAPSVPRPSGPPMILMRNVEKRYIAEKAALENVNVEVGGGEFVFIVGHSGSGKSTFIRMLLREIVPTKGQIIVAGYDRSNRSGLRHMR